MSSQQGRMPCRAKNVESLIVVTRAPGKFGDYALGAHTVPTNSEYFREGRNLKLVIRQMRMKMMKM